MSECMDARRRRCGNEWTRGRADAAMHLTVFFLRANRDASLCRNLRVRHVNIAEHVEELGKDEVSDRRGSQRSCTKQTPGEESLPLVPLG